MIFDHFAELNWLAVVVATLAWFVFSAIWYSLPPISEGWQRAAKVDASQGASVVTLAIPTLIGYFVATIAVAMLVSGIGASTFDEGLALGIVLGLIGIVFIVAGTYAFVKTQEGYTSMNAFSAAQNVKLAYNEEGQLIDRGEVEGAQAIMALLTDEWGYPVQAGEQSGDALADRTRRQVARHRAVDL